MHQIDGGGAPIRLRVLLGRRFHDQAGDERPVDSRSVPVEEVVDPVQAHKPMNVGPGQGGHRGQVSSRRTAHEDNRSALNRFRPGQGGVDSGQVLGEGGGG